MAIVVCRVDDRLVHGQVVVGWGRPLEIERIALVDRDVAGSEDEQELYRLATPPGMAVEFLDPDQAPTRLETLAAGRERVLVLTGSVDTMVQLARAAPTAVRSVTLGGVHDGPARREYLRYVYLTEAELSELKGLDSVGIRVTAQDLPGSRPVSVAGWTVRG
jgi:D-glucosaminate PTS system EIIB component